MTDMNQAPDASSAGDASQDDGAVVTVCISMNASTGEYKVGLQPPPGAPDADDAGGGAEPGEGSPEEEAQDQDSYMKPARDINDALKQAKQLLEQPQTGDGSDSPFEQGFAQARGQALGGDTGGM